MADLAYEARWERGGIHTAGVYLDLTGDDESIVGLRPLSVKVSKFLNWRIIKRSFRKGFLHRTFHQSISQ
jgi:hypothetical protein